MTCVQELSKELEEEVHANRQRFEHIARTHDQQLKDLQQVRPAALAFLTDIFPAAHTLPQTASQREAELLQRYARAAALSCCRRAFTCDSRVEQLRAVQEGGGQQPVGDQRALAGDAPQLAIAQHA